MLYTHEGKNFRQHVHPNLQKRMRIFLVIGTIALLLVAYDVWSGVIGLSIALLSVALGIVIGFITSRIFHLSWSQDGARVVGRIDRIGWFVLGAYIVFEIARTFFFQTILGYATSQATAITFAFVSSALLSRVLGLRGRILRVLKAERVLG